MVGAQVAGPVIPLWLAIVGGVFVAWIAGWTGLVIGVRFAIVHAFPAGYLAAMRADLRPTSPDAEAQLARTVRPAAHLAAARWLRGLRSRS